MGFLPKRLIKENLHLADVLVEDTNNDYFNVRDVPSTFTQGRSAFKIFGSDLLRQDVPLKIEMLDSVGNTIYATPVDLVGEETPPFLTYRYVAVEVYPPPINRPGLGLLTIVGEIDPDKVDVPIESIGTYNVRYSQKVDLDVATVINDQPIRFYRNPTAEYQEIVRARTVLTPISQSIIHTSVSGLPRPDLDGSTITITSASLEKEPLPPQVSDPFKDLKAFGEEFKYKSGMMGSTPALIRRRGKYPAFASKEQPPFKIKTDTAQFTSKM